MTTISATAFGFGAGQSGVTNRNAINNALLHVESLGGGVVTLPAGTFDILDGQYTYANYPGSGGKPNFPTSGPNNIYNNCIQLPSKCTLRGSGREATKLVAVADSNWYLIMNKGWTFPVTSPTNDSCIEDLTLDGNNGNQIIEEWSLAWAGIGGIASGVRLNCHNMLIRNVASINNVWNGLIIEQGNKPTIENCYTHANLKAGIYFSGCTDISARGNFSYDNSTGLSLGGVTGGTVSGNRFGNNSASGIAIARDTARLVISGNDCTFNTGHAISATKDASETNTVFDSIISDNDCSYAGRATIGGSIGHRVGIFLFAADNNLISGNKIHLPGGPGIALSDSKRNKVTANKIYGAGTYGTGGGALPYGIYVGATAPGDSAGNTLSANDIDDSGSPTTVTAIWSDANVTDLVGMYNILGAASSSLISVASTCPQVNWMKTQNRLLKNNVNLVPPAAPTLVYNSGQTGTLTSASTVSNATMETITYWLTYEFTPGVAAGFSAFVLNGLPGGYTLQSVDTSALDMATGLPITTTYRTNQGMIYYYIAAANLSEIYITIKLNKD